MSGDLPRLRQTCGISNFLSPDENENEEPEWSIGPLEITFQHRENSKPPTWKRTWIIRDRGVI